MRSPMLRRAPANDRGCGVVTQGFEQAVGTVMASVAEQIAHAVTAKATDRTGQTKSDCLAGICARFAFECSLRPAVCQYRPPVAAQLPESFSVSLKPSLAQMGAKLPRRLTYP